MVNITTKTLECAAQRLVLRHAGIRLTSRHYADKKGRITSGLDALLA